VEKEDILEDKIDSLLRRLEKMEIEELQREGRRGDARLRRHG
jgi:hypothetical protein